MSFADLRTHNLDFPNEVSVETLALCNAACEFCPYPTLERKGTRMSDALLDRLVDEMASWDREFFFAPFKVNEPLLDVRVIPLLQRMNRDVPKARLRVFTNGSPLTDANVDGLAELKNVEHLWVSLNSHDSAEYERVMRLPFKRTAERLDALHARAFPHPVVVSTVGGPNMEFVAYVAKRWPKFRPVVIKRDSWLGYTNPQVDIVPNGPCSRWFDLSITATGKVSLCCMDGTGQFAIGDVNTQTMLDVYRQPVWRERRRRMLSRRTFHPCSTCTY